MEPLYNRSGRVAAWLQEDVGRIVGLDGRHLAFIARENVYDWRGNHVGWWADGHMRDAEGAVLLWLSTAENLGVSRPARGARPARPPLVPTPPRPVRSVRPAPPARVTRWSSRMPF